MNAPFSIDLVSIGRLPTNVRYACVEFKLSMTAQMLLAIDDRVLVMEAYPSLEEVGPADKNGNQRYKVRWEDAATLMSDLHERSLPGDFGFGHTPYERYAAKVGRDKVAKAMGYDPKKSI